MYREGPDAVAKLLNGFETIGFDGIDMFDHVVMGYPTEKRRAPVYSPQMPIMEAFMMLSFAAAHTQKVALSTTVLVLPQRHPTLVAKQVSTLDTLSGGRIKLGVGTGWQRSEYEVQGADFSTRGSRMDECIEILRSYWRDEHVNYDGEHYQIDEIAMEPKPPQGGKIPIWIGGTKGPALLRDLRHYLEEYDRDPSDVGLQISLSPGPLDKEKRKRFFADPDLVLDRIVELKALGFEQCAIDCVPIFQHGYRTSDALLDYLNTLYQKVKPELT